MIEVQPPFRCAGECGNGEVCAEMVFLHGYCLKPAKRPPAWAQVPTWLRGLYAARCQNGDIVWTQAKGVEHVESSPSAILHIMSDDGGFNRLYWAKAVKP